MTLAPNKHKPAIPEEWENLISKVTTLRYSECLILIKKKKSQSKQRNEKIWPILMKQRIGQKQSQKKYRHWNYLKCAQRAKGIYGQIIKGNQEMIYEQNENINKKTEIMKRNPQNFWS